MGSDEVPWEEAGQMGRGILRIWFYAARMDCLFRGVDGTEKPGICELRCEVWVGVNQDGG